MLLSTNSMSSRMDNMETQAWDLGFCERPVHLDEASLQCVVFIRVNVREPHVYSGYQAGYGFAARKLGRGPGGSNCIYMCKDDSSHEILLKALLRFK